MNKRGYKYHAMIQRDTEQSVDITDAANAALTTTMLAEQLQPLLMQIGYYAQSGKVAALGNIDTTLQGIQRLIDAYLLSAHQVDQTSLNLCPVNPSAVLEDAVHDLSSFARQYGCTLEVRSAQRCSRLIMADYDRLRLTLFVVGMMFIEESVDDISHNVVFAHYRKRDCYAIGAFTPSSKITKPMLAQAKKLRTTAAHQKMSGFSASGNAALLADSLCRQYSSQLCVARKFGLSGLVAEVLPTEQLKIV
jgi:hypothetical protein